MFWEGIVFSWRELVIDTWSTDHSMAIDTMTKNEIIDAESNPVEFLFPELKKMTVECAGK
jgi:hypothetical protein